MLTTLTSREWTSMAACVDHADVFQNPLLEYDPVDHAFLQPMTDPWPGVPWRFELPQWPGVPWSFDTPYSRPMTRSEARATQEELSITAKAVCADCPVFRDCLQWAMSSPVQGVAAGLTAQEAANMRRALNAQEVSPSTTVAASLPPESVSDIDPFEVAALMDAGVPARDLMRRYQVSDRTLTRKRRQAAELAKAGFTSDSHRVELDVVNETEAAEAADAVLPVAVALTRPITKKSSLQVGKMRGARQLWQVLSDGQVHPMSELRMAVVAGGGNDTDVDVLLQFAQDKNLVDSFRAGASPAPAPFGPGVGSAKRNGTVAFHRKSVWMQEVWRRLADGQWWQRSDLVAVALAHGCKNREVAANALTLGVRNSKTLRRDGDLFQATETALESLPADVVQQSYVFSHGLGGANMVQATPKALASLTR